MSLKLITAPAIEPVTLADVFLHTRMSHSTEDDLLNTWIKSARKRAEEYQRRAYIGQVWEMAFDGFPCLPLSLPRWPLLQLISIKYYDTANAETVLYYDGYNPVTTTEEGGAEPETNADFYVDTDEEPGRIAHAYAKTWPSVILRSINSVKIRFAAGYGLTASDVPENVKEAIMLYCSWRNENRAAETEFPDEFYSLLRFER
jgi:hypothetical protein